MHVFDIMTVVMLTTTLWCVCDHRGGVNDRVCRLVLGCPLSLECGT